MACQVIHKEYLTREKDGRYRAQVQPHLQEHRPGEGAARVRDLLPGYSNISEIYTRVGFDVNPITRVPVAPRVDLVPTAVAGDTASTRQRRQRRTPQHCESAPELTVEAGDGNIVPRVLSPLLGDARAAALALDSPSDTRSRRSRSAVDATRAGLVPEVNLALSRASEHEGAPSSTSSRGFSSSNLNDNAATMMLIQRRCNRQKDFRFI